MKLKILLGFFAVLFLFSLVSADIILGDMNGDSILNSDDINPFILALTNITDYSTQYPEINPILTGDMNQDSQLNNLDILPFKEALNQTECSENVSLGDLNGDGLFNENDIQPFVLALTNITQYNEFYPCLNATLLGDLNNDSILNNLDLNDFQLELKKQDCPLNITNGDMNGDGVFNSSDTQAFILALTNQSNYSILYPEINATQEGDINKDGQLNNLDLEPFNKAVELSEICPIEIIEEPVVEEVKVAKQSSSGGGGGSGDSGCRAVWVCSEWSECSLDNGLKSRECHKDRDFCFAGEKPNETESCVIKQEIIINGNTNYQTSDEKINESVFQEQEKSKTGKYILYGLAILFCLVIIIFIYRYISKKIREEKEIIKKIEENESTENDE